MAEEHRSTEWFAEKMHEITDPFGEDSALSPNLPSGETKQFSYLTIALLHRHFSAFAHLLEHKADPNQIMYAEDDPMTVLDYLEMEYHCTRVPGEERVLDGFRALLEKYDAKHSWEITKA